MKDGTPRRARLDGVQSRTAALLAGIRRARRTGTFDWGVDRELLTEAGVLLGHVSGRPGSRPMSQNSISQGFGSITKYRLKVLESTLSGRLALDHPEQVPVPDNLVPKIHQDLPDSQAWLPETARALERDPAFTSLWLEAIARSWHEPDVAAVVRRVAIEGRDRLAARTARDLGAAHDTTANRAQALVLAQVLLEGFTVSGLVDRLCDGSGGRPERSEDLIDRLYHAGLDWVIGKATMPVVTPTASDAQGKMYDLAMESQSPFLLDISRISAPEATYARTYITERGWEVVARARPWYCIPPSGQSDTFDGADDALTKTK